MWARRTRVLVIGAVLTLGLLATVLLQSPAPTRTVDELMASPADHLDQEVAVRGEVLDGTIDNSSMTFVLEGGTSTLTVRFTDAMVSNGLDDNRTVYAEGILRYEEGDYVFDANIIKTSCPSKYEEAASEEE
ncbi:MAG: cytochrome c maturation protein CcmE [Candidatus Thermoplasmatota archaeon]|nr:cytochrome c maturation protein CcmE [Candidatus Thermoplasmatota archaeon]